MYCSSPQLPDLVQIMPRSVISTTLGIQNPRARTNHSYPSSNAQGNCAFFRSYCVGRGALKLTTGSGSWKKLHDGKLHNLQNLPGIVGMIISRRLMDWACSTHGCDEEIHIKSRLKILKERDYSEDVDRDGRIILKWVLSKGCGKV
jgi:hypothetical protein